MSLRSERGPAHAALKKIDCPYVVRSLAFSGNDYYNVHLQRSRRLRLCLLLLFVSNKTLQREESKDQKQHTNKSNTNMSNCCAGSNANNNKEGGIVVGGQQADPGPTRDKLEKGVKLVLLGEVFNFISSLSYTSIRHK